MDEIREPDLHSSNVIFASEETLRLGDISWGNWDKT
jgi:hypothetical protein